MSASKAERRRTVSKKKSSAKKASRFTPAPGGKSREEHIIRTGRAVHKLAAGPCVSSALAEHLGVSERTLSRFMLSVSRAGFPVYTRRTPVSKGVEWYLDIPAYLGWFQRQSAAQGQAG